MKMQERNKKRIALALDAISFSSFGASLYAIDKLELPTIPFSKGILVAEDYALLGLQTVETVRDLKIKKFANETRLSQTWHSIKRYVVPALMGGAAAYALSTSQVPEGYLATISDVAWVVGLGSQFIKDRILYKNEKQAREQ